MRAFGWIGLVLLLGGLLAGCERAQIHHSRFFTLGTLVDASVYTADRAQAQRAFAVIAEELDELHRTWHAWEAGPLATLNAQLARGESAPLRAEMYAPLQQAQRLYQDSQGLFNPALGRLIALWGFHGDEPQGPPPAPEAIVHLLAQQPNMAQLDLTATQVRTDNPAIQLDLGAFIKGYGIDRIIERLQAEGIADAIVNAGGDLRAIGQPGQRPWRIGIRHPSGQGVIAGLEIVGDESVFTSGDYERFYEYQGQRYHHLLDPRTGYPADSLRSVTVLHSQGALADAASTALFIAGPQQWPEVARAMGVDAVMLIDKDEVIYLTQAMAQRLHFLREPTKVVIID